VNRRTFAWIVAFGVAMGFLEAAVVVYLRLLYYPAGFDFPLVLLPAITVFVELGREAATIVMLWAVAALAGRNGAQRFAWFAILFGTWDIVYYVALKAVLDWPASLLTWDVLFLIPLVWTGPVLAPVIVSLGLLFGGWRLLERDARGLPLRLDRLDRGLLGGSFAALLVAFMLNHGVVVAGGIPREFPWWLFVAGCAMTAVVGWRIERR
jgi:hypothetical protein